MPSPFSGVGDALFKLGETRRQKRSDVLDALLKRAQLQQAGFNVSETPGFMGFGKKTILTPNPNASALPEGFVRLPDGSIKQDPGYFNESKYRQQAQIKSEEDVKALELMRNLGGDQYPVGTTARFGRYNVPLNPKLTGDESAAVAAKNVFVPVANEMKGMVKGDPENEGVFKSRFGNVGRTYRQFASGQFGPGSALLTAYDKDLQEYQSKIKSLRRYVFGEGGKQLTPFEANVVMALIDTVGKSDDQIVTDLNEATRIIEEKERLALGGAQAAKFGQQQQGYQIGQVVNINGKQYRVVGGDPNDPEVEPV